MELEKETKTLKETRALPMAIQTREKKNEDGTVTRTITGAIKYQTESEIFEDWWGDEWVEELASGVFSESLKNRDVVGLWSHDTGQVLGSTKSGTLRLEDSEERLSFELDLPNTTAGSDAWESIRRGDVDGVSFGMVVNKDKWGNEERDDGKIYKRTILDAELYEISPVAFPAYPANEVSCRSLGEYKEELKEVREREHTKRKLAIELELI